MKKEKQPVISRRELFEGSVSLGAGLIISACGQEGSFQPSYQASSRQEQIVSSETVKRSLLKAEPTAEKPASQIYPSIVLSGTFLKEKLEGSRGVIALPTPDVGKADEKPLIGFFNLYEYTERLWRKEFELPNAEAIDFLRILIAAGSLAQVKDSTYDLSKTFPTLVQDGKPLRFLALTLDTLPGGAKEWKVTKGPSKGIVLKEKSNVTIIGTYGTSLEEQWAAVSFTDPGDLDEKQVPRQRFAILPNPIVGIPEGANLKTLVEQKGLIHQPAVSSTNILGLGQDGRLGWSTNVLEPVFARQIEQAATEPETKTVVWPKEKIREAVSSQKKIILPVDGITFEETKIKQVLVDGPLRRGQKFLGFSIQNPDGKFVYSPTEGSIEGVFYSYPASNPTLISSRGVFIKEADGTELTITVPPDAELQAKGTREVTFGDPLFRLGKGDLSGLIPAYPQIQIRLSKYDGVTTKDVTEDQLLTDSQGRKVVAR